MVKNFLRILVLINLFFMISSALAEPTGSIRGMVYDKDFDAPLPAAKVTIAETGQVVEVTDEGNYVLNEVAPGKYTLVFAKDGYARQVKADLVVSSGQMTEVDAWLSGDFTDMEEFVVQDVQIGGASETALLELRMESPALMDSISSDLMSQAGASDAASALNLVSGATVEGGKYAVIRGLPDRYVNSQMNGVRLPTADADKRAVQLDQFPSSVIESIQVTKTFTPDQQGDASGGAVNVVLKGIPEETSLKISSSYSYNKNVADAGSDFLSYKGGGLNFWGKDNGSRNIQFDNINTTWDGAAGVSNEDAPTDYKWSISGGGKYEFNDGLKIGAFGSFYYERDSSYSDGVEDKYWVTDAENPVLVPQTGQGSPGGGDFKTKLFDTKKAGQQVQWGSLGVLGLETENHTLSLLYMYNRSAEDKVTLAEDTRGKAYFFPGYDVTDPQDAGNTNLDAAPYLRTETLEYTERTTQTLQLSGRHTLPEMDFGIEKLFSFLNPELDWVLSNSSATLYQPDKRQFGSKWWAESYDPGIPFLGLPPSIDPAVHRPYKPAADFTLGNLQRIWKDISEDSEQYSINLKLPFEQWAGDEGYLKFGLFNDEVTREYDQESFSNFNDNTANYQGPWEEYWSSVFPDEFHAISAADIDVDYEGEQNISAWYYMMDLPILSSLNIIGGARYERTELSIINDAEDDVTWFPNGTSPTQLTPGAADVAFEQADVLPSIGFVFEPFKQITLRGSYSETVARQTFKELSPIQQVEFLGADVFIGNPSLQMSALKNYDLRFDWRPYQGGLFSMSYFKKDITNPIEYVQRLSSFTFTTPVNYPEGEITGFELETRQQMGQFFSVLEGLSIGANATIIDSDVTLPDDEVAQFNKANIKAPMSSRDMTNAPEHLYNIYATYEIPDSGTQLGIFYTVRGDTLIAGAGESNGNFVPNVFETEYGTLSASITQKLGEKWKLKLQGKNLLDPAIETVYRHHITGEEKTKTSYRKGMEFSISLGATF